MNVFQSVGGLVTSFADPPADRKFDLDLGLKDQPKDIQDRHYKVIIPRSSCRHLSFKLQNSLRKTGEVNAILTELGGEAREKILYHCFPNFDYS